MGFLLTGGLLGAALGVGVAIVLVALLDRYVVHRAFYEAANAHDRWFERTCVEREKWFDRLKDEPNLWSEYVDWAEANRIESDALMAIMSAHTRR